VGSPEKALAFFLAAGLSKPGGPAHAHVTAHANAAHAAAAAANDRPRPTAVDGVRDGAQLPPHLATMASELTRGEAQLVDVREAYEAAAGQLVLATLVPLSELRTGRAPRSLDPTRTTYLHCAAGVRVQPAAALMRSMGFARVEPLREGFAALAELGFELSTARAHGTADAVVL